LFSQRNAGTRLRCGEIYNKCNRKLSAECASEIIIKIDQYLVKIWTQV